jgi:APA family basic amino acid/polyamine antiporter
VGIGFARYLGILWSPISETSYLIPPIHIGSGYAVSLSTAQLVGLLVVTFLTWTNTRGIQYGKGIQNVFTCAKIGALLGVIGLGFTLGWHWDAVHAHFAQAWTAHGETPIVPGLTAATGFGLFIALGVSQVGSLFSADAWNNITFTAGEVREPRRNVPLSLALGTFIVIALYVLANVAYLVVLPIEQVQHAPSDRVAGAMLEAIFPRLGAAMMAIAIMISAFGCINGLLLSGARAYFAMARHGLFFRRAATVNRNHVPAASLVMQGVWTGFLMLVRTYDPATGAYGNLYSNLLDYVISAALIFYILTIASVFVLRRRLPNAERPYRAFGYPVVPALYILGAATILTMLFAYRASTTIPGLVIVLLGVPVYLAFRRFGSKAME